MTLKSRTILLGILILACEKTADQKSHATPPREAAGNGLTGILSPDGRFVAQVKATSTGSHYVISDVASGRELFTTRAQFDTANSVEGGEFSGDSRNFGAFYPYSHADYAMWAGIWDVQRGERTEEMFFPQFTKTFSGVFHCGYSVRLEEGACIVSEKATAKDLFKTSHQAKPKNDAKACKLNPLCTRVAAFYHHDDRQEHPSCAIGVRDATYECDQPETNNRCSCPGPATWAGVWSIPDGTARYARELAGYQVSDRTIFDQGVSQ